MLTFLTFGKSFSENSTMSVAKSEKIFNFNQGLLASQISGPSATEIDELSNFLENNFAKVRRNLKKVRVRTKSVLTRI